MTTTARELQRVVGGVPSQIRSTPVRHLRGRLVTRVYNRVLLLSSLMVFLRPLLFACCLLAWTWSSASAQPPVQDGARTTAEQSTVTPVVMPVSAVPGDRTIATDVPESPATQPVEGSADKTGADDARARAASDSAPAVRPPADPEAATADSETAPPVDEAEIDRITTRARQLAALIAGHLDPAVDVDALLQVDLTRTDLDLAVLMDRLAAPPPKRRRARAWKPSRKPPVLDEKPTDIVAARERVLDAFVAWSQLPVAHQAAALAHHQRRVATKRKDAVERQRLVERLHEVERTREQVRDLLAGTLASDVDPAPLLRIDLGDERELTNSPARRARLEAAGSADAATNVEPAVSVASSGDGMSRDPTTPTESKAQGLESMTLPALRLKVEAAETELDRERRRLLRLTPAQRSELILAHHRRKAMAQRAKAAAEQAAEQVAAEQAAAEEKANAAAKRIEQAQDAAAMAAAKREAALEAARQAKSEARRIVAEDQARLLGVSEAQALFDATLAERRAVTTTEHDAVLEQSRKANELVESVRAFRGSNDDADGAYHELREALTVARRRLDAVLTQIATGDSDAPEVGADAADPGGDVDRDELLALYGRVVDEDERLRDLERDLSWDMAASYRDDIVLLNTARLRMLEVTSTELRAKVTGFGADGVRQAAREVEQIGLEFRYQVLSFPRYGRKLLEDFETSPVPVLWGLAQLVFAVVALRWWRRRAPTVFETLQQRLAAVRYQSRLSRASGALLWYVERVRRPLELLAVLGFIARTVRALVDVSQLELLWLVAEWLLIGSAIVLWVDAIAARDSRWRTAAAKERAKLRFRSLRLVGLNIVAVGLLLSMAEVLVGQGAIYGWVLATCWFLAVPIVIVLVGWWRKHVFAALHAETNDKFATWALQHDKGALAFVMAGLGGGYLVGRGVARWVMRRIYDLEITRRLLAYLFRREVAKQAEVAGDSERLTPVEAEVRSRLLHLEDDDLLPDIARAEIEAAARLIRTPRATISAVVGERGMGKSTFLRRLAAAVDDEVIIVECPVGGYAELVAALSRQIGADGDDLDAALEALSSRRRTVVCIDDAQRLVRPVIGGLRGLDALGDLARRVGSHVSWVFAMGTPAWQYVQRARGDRLFFDHVSRLPEWDEDDIAALLRRRTKAAGIEPSFEGLVVPRRYDASTAMPDEDRGEQGFYRILWDYADGNPRVACLFWTESLFRNGAGRLVVRLFKEPSAAELDGLALPIRFVLRSLVQLELGTVDELTEAARMSSAEAADALRYTVAHGYVEQHEAIFSVTWPWYRAVTNMLRRQHLLAS